MEVTHTYGTDQVQVNALPDSISTTTGSLVVSGGLGVAKTLYANSINVVAITGVSASFTNLSASNITYGGGETFSGLKVTGVITGTSAYINSITGTNITTTNLTSTNILDSNGNTVVSLTSTPSPVNHWNFTNGNTGGSSPPTLSAVGSDTSIDLHIAPKNLGYLYIDGGGLCINTGGFLWMPSYPRISVDAVTNRLYPQQTSLTTTVYNSVQFGAIQTYPYTYTTTQMFSFVFNNSFINSNSIILVSVGNVYLVNSSTYTTANYFVVSSNQPSSGTCNLTISPLESSIGNVQITINFAVF